MYWVTIELKKVFWHGRSTLKVEDGFITLYQPYTDRNYEADTELYCLDTWHGIVKINTFDIKTIQFRRKEFIMTKLNELFERK